MSVSKNKGTNSLLKSEKKSLFRFLTLYVTMVIFSIALLSVFYYQSQEKLMLSDQRAMLTKYAYIQTKRLKVLHHFFDERTDYPRDPRFTSAIYDLEYTKIFSLLEDQNIRFDEEIYISQNHIHLVKTSRRLLFRDQISYYRSERRRRMERGNMEKYHRLWFDLFSLFYAFWALPC